MKNKTICFCSGITEQEIKKAVISGASTIKEVREFLSKFESDDCKNKNPSGKCCHGLFSKVIKLYQGTFETIDYSSELYQGSLDFRCRMLYQPINKTLNRASLNEKGDIFVCYVVDGKILGNLIITKIDDENVQIRQVAVDDSLQG